MQRFAVRIPRVPVSPLVFAERSIFSPRSGAMSEALGASEPSWKNESISSAETSISVTPV